MEESRQYCQMTICPLGISSFKPSLRAGLNQKSHTGVHLTKKTHDLTHDCPQAVDISVHGGCAYCFRR
jgi:radical SAM superfamily enzyme